MPKAPDFEDDWVVRWFGAPDTDANDGEKKSRWALRLFCLPAEKDSELAARKDAASDWLHRRTLETRRAFEQEMEREDREHGQ